MDLDIESTTPLGLLAEDMGRAVAVLHCGRVGRKEHFLRLESSRQPRTSDAGARALGLAVERLSSEGRELWDKAKRKEFSVGYEFPSEIRALEVAVSPDSLKRIVRPGATVAFTCYAPHGGHGRASNRRQATGQSKERAPGSAASGR